MAAPAEALEVVGSVGAAVAERFDVVDMDRERPLACLAQRMPFDVTVAIGSASEVLNPIGSRLRLAWHSEPRARWPI